MSIEALDQTWHYVEKWAQEQPEAEALVFGAQRLTWGDFKRQMDRTAKALLEIGVQKGDRVAMLAMARNEFPISFMAANKIGAIWLGMNPKFSLDELRYQIGDCQPSVLIALRRYLDNDLGETIQALKAEYSCLKQVLVIGEALEGTLSYAQVVSQERPELDEALAARSAQVSSADDALLMYTSGSTGKPKGVLHTHHSIVENIKVEVKKFGIEEGSRWLLHFPINHVAADVEIGFGGILAGGCLVMMDRFHPVETLQVIEREKVTVFGQVPVMFLLEMKLPEFRTTDWRSVRLFAWAGAAAPDLMVKGLSMIASQTGANLLTGYGSTEVCGFVTFTEPGDDMQTLLHTAGKIAPPFELRIVDEARNPVADGEIGEIAVRGEFMFKRYWNKPEQTASVLDEQGWYYTSDLAFRDERGYIHITGRSSEMFKTGGENVYPREVEEVLELHPAVLFAAVIAVPDEVYQEVGWAFVMTQPGGNVTPDELDALCRQKLANYKVPKRIFVREQLPLLPNGKVNKGALKQEAKTL